MSGLFILSRHNVSRYPVYNRTLNRIGKIMEYPRIARKAREERAEIFWGDETGISSEDNRGRGYAPKGKTPVVYGPGKRFPRT